MIETTAPKLVRELPPAFVLSHGSHPSFDAGACLMEAVAYVAGEPHSDQPICASPVLTRFAIRLNDRSDDDERQLLAPLIPLLVGTRTTLDIDRRRAYSLVDASIREIAPLGLDAVKWTDLAARLREISPIVDVMTARAARATCDEVTAEGRKRARSRPDDAAAADAADAAAAAAAAYAADAAAAAAYAAAAYAADAAYADAAYADAAAAAAPERARLRLAARRPIVEASVRAFERAIAITA